MLCASTRHMCTCAFQPHSQCKTMGASAAGVVTAHVTTQLKKGPRSRACCCTCHPPQVAWCLWALLSARSCATFLKELTVTNDPQQRTALLSRWGSSASCSGGPGCHRAGGGRAT